MQGHFTCIFRPLKGVLIHWENFKEATIESGVEASVAEGYVNWCQRFGKSVKGLHLRHVQKKHRRDNATLDFC